MSGIFKAKLVELSKDDLSYFNDFHRNKKGKITFIKFLASVRGLYSNGGVCLCTTTIGNALGLSAQTISNYIKELQKLLVIECVDDKYVAGIKSRKYRGTDTFLYELYHLNAKDDFTDAKTVKFVMRELTLQKVRKQRFHEINTFLRKNPDKRPTKAQCKKLARLYVGMHDTLKEDLIAYLDHNDFWQREQALIQAASKHHRNGGKCHRVLYIFYILRRIYRDLGMKVKFTMKSVYELIDQYDLDFVDFLGQIKRRAEKTLSIMGLYIYGRPSVVLRNVNTLGPPI